MVSRLPLLAAGLAVFPFGALFLVVVVTAIAGSTVQTGLYVPAAIEVGLLTYLSCTRPGRLAVVALARAFRHSKWFKLYVVLLALVPVVALWAVWQQNRTNAAEVSPKHYLQSAMGTLRGAAGTSLTGFVSTAHAVGVLEAAGYHPVIGPPGRDQIGVVVAGDGQQVVLVTDDQSTTACLAATWTTHAYPGHGVANVPTALGPSYGEWGDASCDPAHVPAASGITGSSWTSSFTSWLAGS